MSFLLSVDPKCKLNSSSVASLAIVGLKGTVFFLKGVSQGCVGQRPLLPNCASPWDDTVFLHGGGGRVRAVDAFN